MCFQYFPGINDNLKNCYHVIGLQMYKTKWTNYKYKFTFKRTPLFTIIPAATSYPIKDRVSMVSYLRKFWSWYVKPYYVYIKE